MCVWGGGVCLCVCGSVCLSFSVAFKPAERRVASREVLSGEDRNPSTIKTIMLTTFLT